MAFELPELKWAQDSLAPYMSAQTVGLHHGKHHQTYVTNLNNLIKDTPLADKGLEEIIKDAAGDSSKQGIFNNAGQHWNHILFWECMSPKGGGNMPSELESRIKDSFGSVDEFKEEFVKTGAAQFGSGWAWLVVGDNGKLELMKTPNAANPVSEGGKQTLLGCDVWEHSYYLDYQNKRPDYIKAFLDNLVDWEYVASRL